MSARVVGWISGSGRLERPIVPVTRLGATPDNDIAIPVEGVSRQHARIVEEADGYWIEDAKSRNGTWVNGERAMRAKLRHLDVITLGRFAEFVFLTHGAEAPVATSPTLHVQIEWLNGPSAGTTVEIPPGETIIGRADSCGLVVDNSAISRAHARLTHTGDGLTIEDLGTVNGTAVNGRPIVAAVGLESGAEVELGGERRFRVTLDGQRRDAAASAPAGTPHAAQDMEWMTRLVWSESDLEAVRAGLVEAGQSKSKRPASVTPPAQASPPPPDVPAPPPPKAERPAAPTGAAPTELGRPALGSPPVPSGPGATVILESEPVTPPFSGQAAAGETGLDRTQIGQMPPALPDDLKRPRPPSPGAPGDRPDLPPATVLGYRDVGPGAMRPAAVSSAPPSSIDVQPAGRADERLSIRGVRLTGSIGTFNLPLGVATIGRSEQATVRIDSRDVSRVHAVLTVSEHGVTLEDRGSVNGTILNGSSMSGTHPLSDGDHVAIADFEFLVEFQRTETMP